MISSHLRFVTLFLYMFFRAFLYTVSFCPFFSFIFHSLNYFVLKFFLHILLLILFFPDNFLSPDSLMLPCQCAPSSAFPLFLERCGSVAIHAEEINSIYHHDALFTCRASQHPSHEEIFSALNFTASLVPFPGWRAGEGARSTANVLT